MAIHPCTQALPDETTMMVSPIELPLLGVEPKGSHPVTGASPVETMW
jgi:hypothetical protein